jgi:phosphatidylglycerophosphate synthase
MLTLHVLLYRNFHLADAFTLMNGFCGAQSLYASARYLLTSDPRHAWLALWFPLFGAIFDLLDGKVARWRQSSSMLGQELDSLADSVGVQISGRHSCTITDALLCSSHSAQPRHSLHSLLVSDCHSTH